MNKDTWKNAFINRLKSQGGLSDDIALGCYLAGKDDFDIIDDPVDVADEELSYWAQDC